MLIGNNQLLFADGVNLSLQLDGVTHESNAAIVESTSLSHTQRSRVPLDLQDCMVTLKGYYDDNLLGLSLLPNYPMVNRIHHAFGRTVGSHSLSYQNMLSDKVTQSADNESLVKQDVHLNVQSASSLDQLTDWVYGGSVSARNLNQGHSTPQSYVFGNPSVGQDYENLNLDRQEHLGNPTGMEAFFHVYLFDVSNNNSVTFHISSANARAGSAWFSTSGFTTTIYRNSSTIIPATSTLFVNSGLTRRYYSPAVTIPGNTTVDVDFSIFYRRR